MLQDRGKILVTGGAGFIGSHLVDYLVQMGNEVAVLDDFSAGNESNLAWATQQGVVRIFRGTILDDDAIHSAMAGCATVFHLAVQCVRQSLGRPLENHDINATGTLKVLEAARRKKVRRFVYCSSSEVYGNASSGALSEATTVCAPTTVYGAAKLAGELYALAYYRTYGLPVAIVRPFNAYGPREHDKGVLAEVVPRFVIRVVNGLPPVVFGDGNQWRDFTFVTETARGIARAAVCDALVGGVVNIARGQLVSIGQVAEAVARLCQRPELTPIFADARPGDVISLLADTRVAERVLGFKAEIEFEQGLENYLGWFAERYSDSKSLLEDQAINWTLPA